MASVSIKPRITNSSLPDYDQATIRSKDSESNSTTISSYHFSTTIRNESIFEGIGYTNQNKKEYCGAIGGFQNPRIKISLSAGIPLRSIQRFFLEGIGLIYLL